MSKSPILGLAGLVFMAGSLAMLLFLVLSGVRNATPLNKTYFLQAHTEGITGARQISQWTYFYVCGDGNVDCTSAKAAYPFGDAWDSNADNAPDTLIGDSGNGTSSKKIYYLWRFGWVFIMIALFFSSITFIASFLSCCGRLGASIAYYNSLMALLTHSVAAAITTATFVIAQNAFKDAGRDAFVGKYGFGFLWGSWAALLIATGLFGTGRRRDGGGGGGGRFFGRRGNLEGRRVKEEYE